MHVRIWKGLFNPSSTWQRAYQAVIFGKGAMSALQLCSALNATELPNISLCKESLIVYSTFQGLILYPLTCNNCWRHWKLSMGRECSHEVQCGTEWQNDCCFSVTISHSLQSLSWQSWLEMTVCDVADGRGHDNQSVGPFLFCFFFFVLLLIVKCIPKAWQKMLANIIPCSD